MKVVIIFKNKKNYSGGALPAEALTGSAFVCYSHFCCVFPMNVLYGNLLLWYMLGLGSTCVRNLYCYWIGNLRCLVWFCCRIFLVTNLPCIHVMISVFFSVSSLEFLLSLCLHHGIPNVAASHGMNFFFLVEKNGMKFIATNLEISFVQCSCFCCPCMPCDVFV